MTTFRTERTLPAADKSTSGSRALFLGTASLAVCFSAWGLISAFAPRFRDAFHLSAFDTAFLVAVPVLLGSLARVPIGAVTDQLGGRVVFAVLMIGVAVPVALVPFLNTFQAVLGAAFFVGLAGASFAVGVGFVSPWFRAGRQGGALGVYGMGNVGQSAAVFLGPLIASFIGWSRVFWAMAGVLVTWAVVFAVLAREAPTRRAPQPLSVTWSLVRRDRKVWALAACYFLTFGGFVAFSIYLPALLRDQFGITEVDAGFRAGGFVVVATCGRPAGGWLADRIGGARVLSATFLAIVPFALLLSWPSIVPFTIGALACAALLGLGNGAVFKLVPQYFPENTGMVTGVVGAMGGLGGFFPPLLLGASKDVIGAVWPGFVLLAITSAVLYGVNTAVFRSRQVRIGIDPSE